MSSSLRPNDLPAESHRSKVNDTGTGLHNPRYEQSWIDTYLDSYTLKPCSPYDEEDANEAFYHGHEPLGLPSWADFKALPAYNDLERPHWIRVLKLEPGYVYFHIRVSLIHINLDDPSHIPYEALSYTWNEYYPHENLNTKFGGYIIMDGHWMQVSRSLHHALCVLRRVDRARIIWADALCINQKNNDEKKYQVGLMQLIYKRALHVMIWVGFRWEKLVQTSLDLVCKIVNQEYSAEERHAVVAMWYYEPGITDGKNDDPLPVDPDSPSSFYAEDWPEDTSKLEFTTQTMEPLKELFSACYFSRLWVFQEIVLSPSATMKWSQGRIRFEWVALVANLIARNPEYLAAFSIFEDAVEGLLNCANAYNAWSGKYTETPFFDLMIGTRMLIATNPEDKVYGLLGIKTSDTNPEQGDNFMDANYEIEIREVWMQVAIKFLIDQKDMRCLAAVNRTSMDGIDVPSWVPDFANLPKIFLPSLHASSHITTHTTCVSLSAKCSLPACISITVAKTSPIASLIHEETYPNAHWRHISTRTKIHHLVDKLRPIFSWTTIALLLTQGFNLALTAAVTDIDSHTTALRAFYNWREEASLTGDNLILPPPETAGPDITTAYRFFLAASRAVRGKCLFVTKGGKCGIGPRMLEKDGVVVNVQGSRVPLILSSAGVEHSVEHWKLVGPCYVDGSMFVNEDAGIIEGETRVIHII